MPSCLQTWLWDSLKQHPNFDIFVSSVLRCFSTQDTTFCVTIHHSWSSAYSLWSVGIADLILRWCSLYILSFEFLQDMQKNVDNISQLSSHVFTQDGYDLLHFSLKRIRLLSASSSVTAVYTSFRSAISALISLSLTKRVLYLIWWIIHLCIPAFGYTASIASRKPVSPSTQNRYYCSMNIAYMNYPIICLLQNINNQYILGVSLFFNNYHTFNKSPLNSYK